MAYTIVLKNIKTNKYLTMVGVEKDKMPDLVDLFMTPKELLAVTVDEEKNETAGDYSKYN